MIHVLHNYPIFNIIAKAAHILGIETYIIGGFVRDILLSRPSKDIDIVCIGSGIELAKAVASTIGQDNKVQIFKNFGTAMVQWNDWQIEFVGARKESYNFHSRKPVVTTGTLKDDQQRRDFTINAMAIGLCGQYAGKLIDPFDGQQSLKKKIIQTPLLPIQTFSDDPLRMLRAIRFAAQLSFTIAPITLDAIVNNVDRIAIVSKERIIDELHKIIATSKPSIGFILLFQTGLLHKVFPELAALQGTTTINGKSHKDNFYHTLQVVDNVAKMSANIWLRWAAIFHDIAKPHTKKFDTDHGFTFHGHEFLGAKLIPTIFNKMKLPLNEKMAYVQKLVRLHLRPIVLAQEIVTDSAVRRLIYEAGSDIDDLMILCRADITSKNHSKVQRYLYNFELVEKKIKIVEEKDNIRNFKLAISGDEIIQTFNLKPSRVIGEIKNSIKEAVLDGLIKNTYQATYAYMLKIAKKKGLEPKKK